MSVDRITIIGAGLAGCEAAWQAAQRGVGVTLREMKPERFSPAHHLPGLGELVCSNSLRGDSLENAVGLLKEELRRCNSLIMEAAEATRVPAGGALAVDRQLFSEYITDKIQSHTLI
ncbi:MAG TPA: FAD-dependent oxidoreductase, partial [Desulfuromonadaceae bacterium]